MRIKIHTHSNWLCNAGYTQEEESALYDSQLQDVIENPRWYLDNLEDMSEYRVSWTRYTRKFKTTLPLKYVNHQAL